MKKQESSKEPRPSKEENLRFKRLMFAKYLFNAARQGLSSPSPIVAAEALLRLHDSVEIFQTVVLDKIGSHKKNFGSFMDFWQKVEEGTPQKFRPPYKDRFGALNEMRNALKHAGVLPNLSELRELSAVVPSFFDELSAQILKVDFHEVSLADLLDDREIRGTVKKAEAAISSGDYRTAVSELALALDLAMRGRLRQVPRSASYPAVGLSLSEYDIRGVANVLPAEASQRFRKVIGSLESQLLELSWYVEMLDSGIDMQRYRRFKYLSPNTRRFQTGRIEFRFAPFQAALLTEDDADFCLQFAVETALAFRSRELLWLDRRRPRSLRTAGDPTPLYEVNPDNSVTAIGKIPKGCELTGRPCIVPRLGEVWAVTYRRQDGYIRFSEATPLVEGTGQLGESAQA
jgi:hypothetical protein